MSKKIHSNAIDQMRAIHPNVLRRSLSHLFQGSMYLKGRSFMSVKKLARALNTTNTKAGCVLTVLGWIPNNPQPSVTNRTYRRS